MSETPTKRPWHLEPWPWLLMLPPGAAVLAGIMMVYLALHSSNALVVDDYSRIDEITSIELARDRRAAELGLRAEVIFSTMDDGGTRITIELDGNTKFTAPAELALRLQHATNPAADRSLALPRSAQAYIGTTALAAGRYHVEVLPADAAWRLAGSLARAPDTVHLIATAPGG